MKTQIFPAPREQIIYTSKENGLISHTWFWVGAPKKINITARQLLPFDMI